MALVAALAAATAGLTVRAQTAPPTAAASVPAVPPAAPAPVGELKSLGDDRYQIGRIVVDKRAGSFTVPGRVQVTGRPLEYLATSPKGRKGYEALLEVDATGSEFNLACIMIGLERAAQQVPLPQFRRATVLGPKVNLFIAWTDNGKATRLPAVEALLGPDAGVKAEGIDWVYTGSPLSDRTPQFAADRTGSLIGFVHDASTIIEAATAIGIGAYGSVRGHPMLPPIGTPIELIVEAVNATK